MEWMTISDVSQQLGVTTRTLRYYEQIGLLKSHRPEGYAYRVYDEDAISRLRQILLLRQMRFSLKQISSIFNRWDVSCLKEEVRKNIWQVEGEMEALQHTRMALRAFLDRIPSNGALPDILLEGGGPAARQDGTTSSLSLPSKGDLIVENSGIAEGIRILYLPAATVAASRFVGEAPEDAAGRQLDQFVRDTGLVERKPDMRVYGFNNPSPTEEGQPYGYEFWVTIPEDMDVPAPLEKKHFAGGLYAAHCIKMGDFQEWGDFTQALMQSEEYKVDPREPLGMGGCMEEHLNAFTYYRTAPGEAQFTQVDLLTPVKRREQLSR
jgi:DNA-binding transcriptional MerR regulator